MFLVSVWSQQQIRLSLSFSEGVIRTPAEVMLAAVTARLTRPCAEHFMEWLFVSVRGTWKSRIVEDYLEHRLWYQASYTDVSILPVTVWP